MEEEKLKRKEPLKQPWGKGQKEKKPFWSGG